MMNLDRQEWRRAARTFRGMGNEGTPTAMLIALCDTPEEAAIALASEQASFMSRAEVNRAQQRQ